MAAFDSGAFLTDAFSVNAYDFGSTPPVVVVVDTHDGKRKRDIWKKRIQDRERLLAQIHEAIDGPNVQIIEEALEPFARPQISDARLVPIAERIDWDAFRDMFSEIETALMEARRRADDEDDDEFLLFG